MKGVLSPHVGRILQECRRALAAQQPLSRELPWMVDDATRAVEEARRLYDDRAPAVLRTSRAVDEVLFQVGLAFQAVLDGLSDLYPYLPPHPASDPDLLKAALDVVEARAEGLADMLERLSALEAAGDILSPLPTLNGVLKVGVNVLRGYLPGDPLAAVLPRAVAVARRLERRVERFAALHPEADAGLVAAARSLVRDVQDGLGAVVTPGGLKDGLRLLRHGSENLAAALESMDAHVRDVGTWSIVPALEELWRAVCRGVAVEDALESVALLCAFQSGQARALAALPLAFYVEEEARACQEAAEGLDLCFEAARTSLDAETLARLRTSFTEAMAARDRLASGLEREMRLVADSPHLEELKELAARLVRGATTEEHIKSRLVFFIKQHAKLEAHARAAARDALGGEADELLHLLHFQGQGLEEATRYFRDGDTTHLVSGFRRMEDCLPALEGIRDRIWRRLRPRRQGPESAPCFACGSINAVGQRYCRKCGGHLSEIARGLLMDDSHEEGEPEPLPRNVERLQDLVRRWETNTAIVRDIQYEVGLYLERLNSVRRDFERRLVPRVRAEGSGTMLALTREFHENLQSLQDGLRAMAAFTDETRPDVLYRGLQDCVDAARVLREAQERIEAALPPDVAKV